MFRLILITCTLLFISACSTFHSSSNLDRKNFEDYFKPSQVTIYKKSELANIEYDVLGAVEGSSCQLKENAPIADIREARTNARINAAALKANGIIFQTCINFEKDNACISNIICYGRALNVIPAEQE